MCDRDDQLEVFPREMVLRRIDPERNMRRFYRLSVEPDLFGGACLVREWGRMGRSGQCLSEPHADEGKAINALLRRAATKRRRGYQA
ncbi:WGR domain-containing protein [Paracoccus sp. CPCC 101403]|uniref:WGR domain-containing protein n=1 Tax=Paracoccus broussonetiae TaxID=3075834 RepID=A0ABU3EIY7_9RHOB|nr:WGR domain-containing protein [Paracoccus sp. CPCC 101403]MDT1064184.1 WGR domain-containing protein [Paracoccus sp. CPCC 101403]